MCAEAGVRIRVVEVGGHDRSLGFRNPEGEPSLEFPAGGKNRRTGRRVSRSTSASIVHPNSVSADVQR